MGGLLSCFRRRETREAPEYNHILVTSEEQDYFSRSPSTSSASSPEVHVDANLEGSIRDSYEAPPASSADIAWVVASLQASFGGYGNKSNHIRPTDDPNPTAYTSSIKNEHDSVKLTHDVMDEKDECAICLEEYNPDNPQKFTKCKHHFHFSCILEWMERSPSCPMCNEVILLEEEP